MTVSTTKASDVFPGNGVATGFDCEWRIFDDTDVLVSLVDQETGADTPLVLNTDYTISGAGDQAGFTIATMSPVATGTSLYARRALPFTQPTDFTNQGAFFPTMHEDAMDRLEMQIQQQSDDIGRSLKSNAVTGNFNLGGKKIAGSAVATDGADVPSLEQVQTLVASAASGIAPDLIVTLPNLASTAAGKGASLIGFTQAGVGAAARTLQDKARETRISVKDFGAVGDGVADDTAAFNAAVTYCASRKGGQILVPAGTYKITSMITVSDSDIVFVGEGFDTFHDAGSMAHNTLINWAGAAGVDAVFLFTSIAGATNKCLAGCGVLDLAIIGGDSVKSCVELRSHREGRFRFFGGYCTDYILKMGVVSQLGEAEDTQSNVVELWGRQFSTGGSGIGLFGNGNNPPNANTSFNQFKYVDLQINTGTGIVFGNCDTNIFDIVRVTGVTTGKAYEFQGSNLNTSDTARGNWVKFLSSQGPGYSRGTTSYTYPAVGNSIGLDTGNGTPLPTVETGSTCYYTAGFVPQQWMPAFARATLAGDVNTANTERSNATGETLRVHSGSSNHIRVTDGTSVWGINMTGGDLRIHLIAGTGTFRFGSFTSNADAPINGYVTIKDANGNIRKLATIA